MISIRNILKENPDTVKNLQGLSTDTSALEYSDLDAYPFGFWKGKAYFGRAHTTHHAIGDRYWNLGLINRTEYIKFPKDRRGMKNSGRLWTRNKVISFWDYPNKSQLKSVISKLEKASKLKMWNSGWKIEVVDVGGKLYEPEGKGEWHSWKDLPTKLVPLEKYVGSQKQIGKETSHQKSPLAKKSKEVPIGVGSRKKVKGSKKGEVPAATKFRQRKGLGDGVMPKSKLIESNNNNNTKPLGTPRGKFSYMDTNGVDLTPPPWNAKLIYWRKMINKMIGYEVLE